MRVTFVLPHAGLSGGIRVLSIYAERLNRRGHEVTVLSQPRTKRSLLGKMKSLARGTGWPTEPGRESSFFDDCAVPHRVLESARPVVDDDVPDADVVLATYWKTAPWVAALSPRKGAKAILLQGYETSPGHWERSIDAAWRLPLHKIAVSKWLVDLARDRFDDLNVHLIPNSVDTGQFHASPRGKRDRPTVGMLYSTLHLRGVDVSLAALEKVKKQMGDLRVVAFGAEPVSARLPLPAWAEFHYLPAQSELRLLYGQCDVWLCGSRREGFHLPMLEAMACRCPVVSTRMGGAPDIVEDGINGFLAEVENPSELSERLGEVLRLTEAKWRGMSDAALRTANRYTWDDATDLLEAAFFDMIGDTARPCETTGWRAGRWPSGRGRWKREHAI
ncbi:glycosyltransferase family 4 protein [Bradyrhizobium genosp. SA-3]|uniref:glycosyltransferase family 4 protein n=1 Tax=Bradyrhizobium genosp. SA-3 TaxID=508868 RepID=UPI0013EEAA92|nr:glycosyltransferase family 4 protein [Bradyrhizobium genosp. SA-3]